MHTNGFSMILRESRQLLGQGLKQVGLGMAQTFDILTG